MEAYRNGPGMGILIIDAEAERSQHEVVLMANAKGKMPTQLEIPASEPEKIIYGNVLQYSWTATARTTASHSTRSLQYTIAILW
jgi:hypothetical protein